MWTVTIREVMPGFGVVPFFEFEDAAGVRITGAWVRNTDGTFTSPRFEATDEQVQALTEFEGFRSALRVDHALSPTHPRSEAP